MKKRVMAVFMSLCLLAGVLGYPGLERTAQAVTTADGLWTATVRDGYAIISKYNGSATEIVVPDTIDGVPVQELSSNLFSEEVRRNLTSVTFPGTVKSLPNAILKDAVSLTRITLPEGLESLAGFSGCTSLEEITLPSSLKSIPTNCFQDCTTLERITLPEGVTSFSGQAFWGCTNMKEVTVNTENTSYCSVDGVVYNKDMTRLVYYPSGKSFTKIPDSVTSIGAGAFINHQTLSAITLPDELVSIGNYAFRSCIKLSEIQIPDRVMAMGNSAFWGCSSLISVKLPKKITSLNHGMFQNCTSLREIVWPENLTELVSTCFYGCTGLTSITLPDTLTKIGPDNFAVCNNLSAIHLPKNLETVGTCVFSMSRNLLGTLMFPEGTVTLGESMFFSSSGLEYVVIPRSVTGLGGGSRKYGFWDQTGSAMDAVYLCYKDSPAEQFAKEKEIPYEIIGETYHVEGDFIYTIKEDGTVKIISYAGVNPKLRFPEKMGGKKVTEYGTLDDDDRFRYRTPNYHVTSLILPDGMTSIGREFQHFYRLSEVTIPESVTDIQEDAFMPDGVYETDIVVKGVEGSYAQTFAEENKYTFVPITSEEMHTHTYRNEVTKQPTCTEPGVRTYTCTGCDDSYTESVPASGHTVVTDAAVAPTATTAGKTEGSHCRVCGTVLKKQEVIPATGTATGPTTKPPTEPTTKPTQKPEHTHVYTEVMKCAAFLTDGSIQKACSICSEVKETKIIYCPKTIRFSEDDYIYNGKVKTPAVKIKDRRGTLLRANRDYKVTYEAGRKNPGKYKVTVEFMGNYRSKATKSFTIRPKGTKLKKLKAKSKGFQAVWKINKKQTDGYQIQYCTGGNFTKKKTKTTEIKKNTTVRKKFSSLKKKKKYYVRIRTYKKVMVDGASKMLYSDWSNTKTVKTKK